MEDLGVRYSERLQNSVPWVEVRGFLQAQVNRLSQGAARYGWPERRKKYLKRMQLELKAYKATGNAEHLFNIANYAFLESYKPQHRNHHYDAYVDSVTRGRGLE